MTPDPFAAKADGLRRRILDGPGTLPNSVRHAAFAGQGTDPATSVYVQQIHADALRVTDAQIDALRATLSEDAIFELTIAAASGAGFHRLDRVLTLLAEDEP